jgi:hypothetical protein
MTTTTRSISNGLFALGLFLIAAGCSIGGLAIGPSGPPATPRPCPAVFEPDQCDALLSMAAESLGVADADVLSIEIAPDPTPRADGVLEVRSGSAGIGVIATVAGGQRETRVCMGVSMEPACTDQPTLAIGSAIGAGYEDVPCAGEPPDGCASPVPSPAPDALAAARPLRIERRVIVVPGVGRHEVSLGTATIPNGVLTVARAELGDAWPDGVRFSSEGLRLEVRSLVDGRPPFQNIHQHGWYPGTEEVEVLLVFEARRVEPGATIEIRNLVVG